ncbi:MAG: endonuclease domain-containing protein [Dehalococcoidia bacterium]|nr:endonuclease domain-containing protein [Dehalococcoidia bacterium]
MPNIEMKKDPNQTAFARQLRQKQTDAERALWARLRRKSIAGARFRRQQPVDRYIVDFACLEEHLVIEIDGGQHAGDNGVSRDERRSMRLRQLGYRVLRFWDNEVLTNTDGVVERITEVLTYSPPSP